MKTLTTTLSLMILYGLPCFAQVEIKPSAGVNFSNFSKEPATGEYRAQVGFQAGVSVNIGKKFFVEPGAFYVRKSTEYITEGAQAINVNYDISGIQVPVSVGFRLIGTRKSLLGVTAFGGGSAFILTAVKDFKLEDFNRAQYSLHAGVGSHLSVFFVNARYEWSLSNVQENISQINLGQSRSIYINGGFRIPL